MTTKESRIRKGRKVRHDGRSARVDYVYSFGYGESRYRRARITYLDNRRAAYAADIPTDRLHTYPKGRK